MFENIIGQQEIISELRAEMESRQLPPAILFHGPAYTGKLSTALEIARIRSCAREGGWGCACQACERQRLLVHSNLLMLGTRDFGTEIAAAADVLQRTGKLSARYLFIRAVRKQLKGFDPVLWEGETSSKVKSLRPTIRDCEEILTSLHPDLPLPPEKKLAKILSDARQLAAKLAASSRSDNIPISQVRRAVFWAHHSSSAGKKVIIIDNADKMLDSSRNSLLKVLEEPPEELTIILLSTRKGAIIRTILSRLRPYNFQNRTREEAKHILHKIFRDDATEFTSLRDFFLAWRDLNPIALRKLAHKFLQLLIQPETEGPDIREAMEELFSSPSPRESMVSFCEEMAHIFRQMLHEEKPQTSKSGLHLARIEGWTEIMRESLHNLQQLNLNPNNVLETMYYKMGMRI